MCVRRCMCVGEGIAASKRPSRGWGGLWGVLWAVCVWGKGKGLA